MRPFFTLDVVDLPEVVTDAESTAQAISDTVTEANFGLNMQDPVGWVIALAAILAVCAIAGMIFFAHKTRNEE